MLYPNYWQDDPAPLGGSTRRLLLRVDTWGATERGSSIFIKQCVFNFRYCWNYACIEVPDFKPQPHNETNAASTKVAQIVKTKALQISCESVMRHL